MRGDAAVPHAQTHSAQCIVGDTSLCHAPPGLGWQATVDFAKDREAAQNAAQLLGSLGKAAGPLLLGQAPEVLAALPVEWLQAKASVHEPGCRRQARSSTWPHKGRVMLLM